MSQRIIILGAGRFGEHLATRLSEYGCEVAILDQDPNRVKDLDGDSVGRYAANVEVEYAFKEMGVT